MRRQLHTWDDSAPMRRRLPPDVIFVFGSNLRGRHGQGAAFYALTYFGAQEGQGEGLQGQSYAIPTRDHNIQTRSLNAIHPSVRRFVEFAHQHPRLNFLLTPIGCGRAGYQPEDIAPMLQNLPSNCAIPQSWVDLFPGYYFTPSEV